MISQMMIIIIMKLKTSNLWLINEWQMREMKEGILGKKGNKNQRREVFFKFP